MSWMLNRINRYIYHESNSSPTEIKHNQAKYSETRGTNLKLIPSPHVKHSLFETFPWDLHIIGTLPMGSNGCVSDEGSMVFGQWDGDFQKSHWKDISNHILASVMLLRDMVLICLAIYVYIYICIHTHIPIISATYPLGHRCMITPLYSMNKILRTPKQYPDMFALYPHMDTLW